MTAQTGELREIALKDLVVHSANPRKDAGDIKDLADSIREHGVITPLVAVRENGHFAVLDGSRRLAAARLANRDTVPVVVRDATERDARAIAIVANLKRDDLNPLEQAEGFRAWLQLTDGSQEDLAKAVGLARSTITNALRLLEAPKPIRDALEKGAITAAHARVALTVPERSLDLLPLKSGVSVELLAEQAKRAIRLDGPIASLRASVAKAQEQGKTVTWPTSGYERKRYIAGQEVDLIEILGTPKAKLAGELTSYDVTRAVHDLVCECETLIVGREGLFTAACSSPTGWKKAQARARASRGQASPQAKKKVQSAAAKAALLRRVEKQSEAEATKAFAGTNLRSWSGMTTSVAPKFFKGGITGEPARLVLFGLIAKYADARGPMWKIELWKKIAAAPLSTVKDRIEKYLLGLAFREIADASRYQDKYGNTRKIRALVDAHYAGGKAPKAKKAAKR